jgi:hypothetical protein
LAFFFAKDSLPYWFVKTGYLIIFVKHCAISSA